MNPHDRTSTLATKLERWPADRLRPDKRNARTHSQEQVDQIALSIERFGFNNPILIDAEGGVIAGHGRLEASKQLGLDEVPVLLLDHLTPAERRAYLIADNRLSELAGWDQSLLVEELEALEAEGLPHDLLGFSDEDLALLCEGLGTAGDEADLDEEDPSEKLDCAEELLEKWKVQEGQLWLIGPHRLLCGDARDPAAFKRLMDRCQADLVFTDPPYGVDYVGKTKDALTIQNDGQGDLGPLLAASLGNACAFSKAGAGWYVTAPAGPQFLEFALVLSDLGIWRQTLVWLKNSLVMGHSDFHYRHEAIFYGWKPGAAHHAPGDRTNDTIWEFDRPSRSEQHPTMKPVNLIAHAIRLSTDHGALVLDPFAGSGSLMAAADATSRVCNSLEMEPKYCAVILERMEALGLNPQLEDA